MRTSCYTSRCICVLLLLTVFCISCAQKATKEESEIIKKMFVAGQFYPKDSRDINQTYDEFISEAKIPDGVINNIHGLIVPHAGWIYSGGVTASGVNLLNGNYKRIIIIANNHAQVGYYGASVPVNITHYMTPLGLVPLDLHAIDQLEKKSLISFVPKAHTSHVIEVILPFLQKKVGDFKLVPVIIGGLSEDDLAIMADIIEHLADDQTLIIISSDLSHYHEYEDAKERDLRCIGNIERQDYEKVKECEACGIDGIRILLEISRRRGWQAKVIEYKNSGDTAGSKESVVGYSSIAFFSGNTRERELVALARSSMESAVRDEASLNIDLEKMPEEYLEERGCFVTLRKKGQLRGCIGYIEPQYPLYRCIIDNAKNAALNDRRFSPVGADELYDIDIEISILTIPVQMKFEDSDEMLSKIREGIDGVIIRKGLRSATYLPSVWDQLPNKEEFLMNLCIKAGMDPDCYTDDIDVFTYQAEELNE